MAYVILVMIMHVFLISVVSSEDFSSLQTANNSDTGRIDVYFAFPPIWHTSYDMRMCSNLLPLSLRTGKGEILPEYEFHGNFKVAPWDNISKQAVVLSLSCYDGEFRNISEQMQNGFVRNYTQLNVIVIQFCKFPNITENTFLDLSKLKEINMESNQLKWLHPKAFWSLSELNWVRLVYNELMVISPNYFCNNPKISFIEVYGNNITEIDTAVNDTCLFTNINSLVLAENPISVINLAIFQQFRINGVLNVAACRIRELSEESFKGIPGVLGLDLGQNLLNSTPAHLFQPMNQSLQLIDLDDNSFEEIDIHSMFGGLLELLEIRLQNNTIKTIHGSFSDFPILRDIFLGLNKLTSVPLNLFQNTTSLKQLDLKFNHIEIVHRDAFKGCVNIKLLDLSGNRLKVLQPSIIGDLLNIQHFNISLNNLMTISQDILASNKHLKVIDMSGNLLNSSGLKIPESLETLNLSTNVLKEMTLSMLSSSTNCSLSKLNLSNNLLESINLNQLRQCLNILDLSNNSIEDISGVESLSNSTVLKLRSNRIQRICPPFEIHDRLTHLDIGENEITSLCKDAFVGANVLKAFFLDNNQLTYVDDRILKDAPNLQTLTMAHNPLQCNCHLEDLQQFLKMNVHIDSDNITCVGGQLLTNYNFDYCKRSNIIMMVIVGSVLLCLILIIGGVIAVFRYEIQVIAFYKWNIRLTFCKKSRKHVSFKYDIFLCFAEEDLSFVKDTLLPMLEPQYRVCVYYRDFFVGDDIADAIIEVINNSQVTVILLSGAFINSRWGRFEFKHAHYQSMTVENQKMILVVMEQDVLNMKLADLTLRSILYSKVYIRKDDRLFREKLIFAMPEIQVNCEEDHEHTVNDSEDVQPLL